MEIGPVEYIVIDFPGNQFNGEILPALQDLVDSGTIHILDLLIVSKDSEGNITILELDEVDELAVIFEGVEYEVMGLFNDEDILAIAEELPSNSTSALMVWEDVWAAPFAQAVRNANGIIIENERIPHELIQSALEFAGE
ncbi:MAG: DUF6325 family protein [Chloroflexota bacterium]